MDVIPSEVMQAEVHGVNLRPGTLADQLGEQATLLVFLRHFGWQFCREMVGELRKVVEADPSYPPVLLFHQGTVEDGTAFFSTFWPEARAVSDEDEIFYPAFGIGRAGFMQVFGPGATACSLRAVSKGYLPGKPIGDPWLLPGLFLVLGERIHWQHDFAHVGDHPDFARLSEQWAAVAA